MLKILEVQNFDICAGDRDQIQAVGSLEEARSIVQERLANEGDHASWNPMNGTLYIKSAGGPEENRSVEHNGSIFWLATHGSFL